MKPRSQKLEGDGKASPKASRFFWLLALAWGLLIHSLVGGPSPGGGEDPFWTFWINGGHAALFAVQAFLLGLALGRRAWGLAALLAFAFGGVEEWIQMYLPDRSASLFDWATDGFGALFGVELFRTESLLRRRSLLRMLLWVVLASLSALGDTLWG
ncbi:MAG TPA: VanZ family protein [Planctomycetes bacterium]|nr:VanZ family protein [Planctomycetota bacterium]